MKSPSLDVVDLSKEKDKFENCVLHAGVLTSGKPWWLSTNIYLYTLPPKSIKTTIMEEKCSKFTIKEKRIDEGRWGLSTNFWKPEDSGLVVTDSSRAEKAKM